MSKPNKQLNSNEVRKFWDTPEERDAQLKSVEKFSVSEQLKERMRWEILGNMVDVNLEDGANYLKLSNEIWNSRKEMESKLAEVDETKFSEWLKSSIRQEIIMNFLTSKNNTLWSIVREKERVKAEEIYWNKVEKEEAKIISDSNKLKPTGNLVWEWNEQTWKISPELKEYRELWKEKVKSYDIKEGDPLNISNEGKKKIIEAVDKMKVNVQIDGDWTRLVEFRLWNKLYRILDLDLSYHINWTNNWEVIEDPDEDNDYDNDKGGFRYEGDEQTFTVTDREKTGVTFNCIEGNDIYEWKDSGLIDYIAKKRREWFHIPSKSEIEDILDKLWEVAGLKEFSMSEKVAMMMYLTWMEWKYYLTSNCPGFHYRKHALDRDTLDCCSEGVRMFSHDSQGNYIKGGFMCMIAYN